MASSIEDWKSRYDALTREEARKRLAFFSLSQTDQEQAFQLVVELQNGDRRVHLQDMMFQSLAGFLARCDGGFKMVLLP